MKSPLLVAASMAAWLGVTVAAMAVPEPLFDGLGVHARAITTKSPEAQKYFNQGLRFLYGFNHGAAIRSFREAARLDPDCAMAHWGIALAHGPHINFPLVPPPAAEAAWAELALAQRHAANGTPVERDLIAALAARYANPQPETALRSTSGTPMRCVRSGKPIRTTPMWARCLPRP
jgi:hypothetical protein